MSTTAARSAVREGAGGEHDPGRVLPRLLPGPIDDPASFADHVERYGPLPAFADRHGRVELLDAIAAAGLTGRGGAGFPTAVKLGAVAKGGRPIVVANGTEGEPASRKDAILLSRNPHLVIDGAIAAADATGAGEIVITVANADDPGRRRVTEALASRRAGLRHEITIAAIPDRFVAGEESALVHWLNGGPAKPTAVPPRPFESGVRGRPTLVQNVETLANIALIGRHGSDWFRRIGTAREPGSALVTLLGAVARPGVLEVALGTRLADIFARAGSFTSTPQAILVGGYFGTWVDAPSAHELALTSASLGSVGASLGARIIAVLPDEVCGVTETARVVRYLAGESAEQCGPCLFGLRALADAMEAVANCTPASAAAVELLPRLESQIARRGACAHPDGAVGLAASARRVFAEEIELHLAGRCSATDRRPLLPIPAGPRNWR